MFCSRQQKIISRTFKIRGTLVFLCPKERERERDRGGERAREKERERERERERGRGREKERETERDREEKSVGHFISKPPGQSEKPANYTVSTVCTGKSERAV
jgi:hypothetical protein